MRERRKERRGRSLINFWTTILNGGEGQKTGQYLEANLGLIEMFYYKREEIVKGFELAGTIHFAIKRRFHF